MTEVARKITMHPNDHQRIKENAAKGDPQAKEWWAIIQDSKRAGAFKLSLDEPKLLEEEEIPEAVEFDDISQLEAGAWGVADSALMGGSDELYAGVKGFTDQQEGEDWEDSARRNLEHARGQQSAARKKGGYYAGALIPAVASGGGNAANLTRAQKVLTHPVTQGAMMGFGSSNDDDIRARLLDALGGGVVGMGASAAGYVGNKVGKKAAKSYAAYQAKRALGGHHTPLPAWLEAVIINKVIGKGREGLGEVLGEGSTKVARKGAKDKVQEELERQIAERTQAALQQKQTTALRGATRLGAQKAPLLREQLYDPEMAEIQQALRTYPEGSPEHIAALARLKELTGVQ